MKRILALGGWLTVMAVLLSGCLFGLAEDLYRLPEGSPGYEDLTQRINEARNALEREYSAVVEYAQIYSGDMPTPIKYDNPELQNAYKQVEASAERRLLDMLPPELRPTFSDVLSPEDHEIRALVKAADKLSAYLKCVEEVKAGNAEFKKAKEQTYAALNQNPLPALR